MGDLTWLAANVAKHGVMTDINVMHTAVFAEYWPRAAEGITTKYVLAFGERRWRASRMAGKKTIPAVLRNNVVEEIRAILFSENFHRKQLRPIEEAREFKRLKEEEGLSTRQIAAELNLSGPGYVAGRLKLLDLPEELQAIVGTEDGPGVSMARTIARQLDDPEDMLLVWELIRDEGVSVKEAVRRLHSGDVSVLKENGVPEPRNANPADNQSGTNASAADAAGAGGVGEPDGSDDASTKREASDTQPDTAEASSTAKTNDVSVTPQKAPKPAAGKKAASAQDAAQRSHASADREMTCQNMVAQGVTLTPEQVDGLFARALLAPTQQAAARASAQKWLREAGKAVFTVSDTESYFEAVLSSGNHELVKTVTVVTALAACEVRARDGRRQWDVHDAEHVRLLIEAGNHHPESAWERAQLTKYGVPFPVGDAADADSIN